MYLSPAEADRVGPDQLQKHVIEPGGTFTLDRILVRHLGR